jgi:hypothetical protein
LEPWKSGPQSAPVAQPAVSTIFSGIGVPHLVSPAFPNISIPALSQIHVPQLHLPQLPISIPQQIAPVPFGFVATIGHEAFVVIRGTLTPLEWLADFTIIPTPFSMQPGWGHTTQGYKSIYDQIRGVINNQIKTLITSGQITQVYVTGHSLGAALAHLIAADLSLTAGISPVTYTFSGPRAGDHEFALAYAKAGLETWRIFNTEDIVPTLPLAAVELVPQKIGLTNHSPIENVLQMLVRFMPSGIFQHVGNPLALTFHKGTIADNHNLTATYQALP